MMEKNTILKNLDRCVAIWCGADTCGADLANVAGMCLENKFDLVSVPADLVKTVWPWLEQGDVKIMGRFYFPDKKITENQISDMTIAINNVLKCGAFGAQVFLKLSALSDLVEQTYIIKDDLFFAKDLIIGLDILDIDVSDWNDIFVNLQKINAAALMVVMTRDLGNESDFVGRIYGLLSAWNIQNNFDLHFYLGPDSMRIEQVLRLVKKMRPELESRLKFFIHC